MSHYISTDRFRTASVTLNAAYEITFGVLLLATCLALFFCLHGIFSPFIEPLPDRWHVLAFILAPFGHVIALVWMGLVGGWVRRQEKKLGEVPKADLEGQLLSVEREAMLTRILWSVLTLVWLGLAADLALLIFI